MTARTALATQIEAKAQQVLRHLGRGRMRPNDLDDVIRNVVERVYIKAIERPELRDDELNAYTARSARNAYIDVVRAANRKHVSVGIDNDVLASLIPDADRTPASQVVAKRDATRREAAVRDALATMNPCDVRLYELYYGDG